jgi:hypothetical protein
MYDVTEKVKTQISMNDHLEHRHRANDFFFLSRRAIKEQRPTSRHRQQQTRKGQQKEKRKNSNNDKQVALIHRYISFYTFKTSW